MHCLKRVTHKNLVPIPHAESANTDMFHAINSMTILESNKIRIACDCSGEYKGVSLNNKPANSNTTSDKPNCRDY